MRGLVALALLMVSSLAHAAFFDKTVSDEALAEVREIGVVSALGDTFYTVRIGPTIFQNSLDEQEAPELGIDSSAQDFIVGALERSGRVKARTLDPQAVGGDLLYESRNRFVLDERKVRELARNAGLALILVVNRHQADLDVPAGYGLYVNDRIGVGVRCAYSTFFVDVWDVRTGKLVGHKYMKPCAGGDEELPFRPRMSEFTPEERQLVQAALRRRLEQQLGTALTALGLLRPDGGSDSTSDSAMTTEPARSGTAPRVVEALGVPSVSAVKMTCKKPFGLTRDCSNMMGPKRKIVIDGHAFKIAGNESGTVTVMFAGLGGKEDPLANQVFDAMKAELTRRGLAVVKVTPIESLGMMFGYAVETDRPSYDVWESFLEK